MRVHRSFRTAALCAAAFTLCATVAQAQQRIGGVAPAAAPSAGARATAGAPNPAGLASPAPAGITAGSGTNGTNGTPSPTNPAGLPSQAPAGLTAGSGGLASGNPAVAGTAITPPGAAATTVTNADGSVTTTVTDNGGTTTTTTTPDGAVIGSSAGAADAAAGAGVATGAGVASNVVRGPSQTATMGSSGANPVEVARTFIHADANNDGELSRAEALRLGRSAISFEEMDRDFDGVLTRSEYEDALR